MAPRVSDDLHERFVGWLLAGAEGDPPRDVAIHAALCPECGHWIAAQDALAGIDPGRAPLPPSRALAQAAPGWRPVVRLAAATGSLLVIGGVGALGASQLMGSQTGTTQEVLAATGTPEATARAPTGLGGKVTAGAAASQTEAASSPTSTTRRAPRPTRSASATKAATAHATSSSAVTTKRTSAPTATPRPTPAATPTDTPTPTPAATPTPTPVASL
ncbi:MAG: hypothetical protein M3P14_11115 [Chloroflexota bacterium]|nr:hypothetical protein [Chloroflexota bacterium]